MRALELLALTLSRKRAREAQRRNECVYNFVTSV